METGAAIGYARVTEGSPMQRRVAAILAADIAGYSSLLAENEALTLEALRRMRREVFAPAVSRHGGKIVKSMGDGWLVEFASTLDAVECAMRIQDRLMDDPILKLRIGVHVGDVVFENEDLFGDGVNIAARLEQLSAPGSVTLSDQAYSSLDGTLAPSFDDMGIKELKNISRPVRVWARAAPSPAQAARVPGRLRSGFPSISVIPVQTSDPRPEVCDLAAALTSDLALFLGSPGWLTARITERPDGGSFLLEPKLRTRGDKLRFEARLHLPSGEVVGSTKLDGDLSQSFEWQDQVGEATAANAIGTMFDVEARRLASLDPESMTASDHLLAGILARADLSPRAVESALGHYEQAIRLDPKSGQAYAEAINVYRGALNFGYENLAEMFGKLFEGWLSNSTRLRTESASLDLAHAWIEYTRDRDVLALRRKLEDSLRRAPFDPEVLHLCCIRYVILGEPESALDCYQRFDRLGRFSPFREAAAAVAALARLQMGNDEAAIAYAEAALERTREFPAPYRVLAAANAHLGRRPEAERAVRHILRFDPQETVSNIFRRLAYADRPGNDRFRQGLVLAGLPK